MGRDCGFESLDCFSFHSGYSFRRWGLSSPGHMCFFRILWSTETLIFRQFGLGYFRLFHLGFFFVVFVFFILVVLEASGVWHLTSFELVLSIKSIFIRLGPDWFVCCSGRGSGREGSHGALHGEPEKIGRRILSQVS